MSDLSTVTDRPVARSLREERRSALRFPLRLECSYRVFNRHGFVTSGSGKTSNISATGLLLSGSNLEHEGLRIEVAVRWPSDSMTLAVRGRIVRLDHAGAGVQVMRHAFVPSKSKRLSVAASVD